MYEKLKQILEYLEMNTVTGHVIAKDMLKELLKEEK